MKNDWLAQGCDHGTVVLSLDSEGQALVLCVVCHTSWTVPLSTPVSGIVRDVFADVLPMGNIGADIDRCVADAIRTERDR